MTDREYYDEEEQSASESRYRNKEKRVGYVPLSNALIRLFADLPDAALRTYLVLCSYAFGRGETFVGQETLCQLRGAHLSTIIKHINSLKEAGLISVERRGQGKTNIYIIEDIPEKALDEYIKLFIDKEAVSTPNTHLQHTSHKHEVLTSQKRNIKTSQKRKTSNNKSERTKEEQQQLINSNDSDGHTTVVVASMNPTTNDITNRLAALGVATATVKKILKNHDSILVYRWICYVEHKLRNGWLPKETPAAWVVSAIQSNDWLIPSWFQTPEEEQAVSTAQYKNTDEKQRLQQADIEQEQNDAAAQRSAIEMQLGVGEETRQVWERVKALLHENDKFSIAYHTAHLMPLNGTNVATIATPVVFFRDTIEKHSGDLTQAISEISGKNISTINIKLFDPIKL